MTSKVRRDEASLHPLNGGGRKDMQNCITPEELKAGTSQKRSRNSCSPCKRGIPRKPSPAQIKRFEVLRARVMGIPGNRRTKSQTTQ